MLSFRMLQKAAGLSPEKETESVEATETPVPVAAPLEPSQDSEIPVARPVEAPPEAAPAATPEAAAELAADAPAEPLSEAGQRKYSFDPVTLTMIPTTGERVSRFQRMESLFFSKEAAPDASPDPAPQAPAEASVAAEATPGGAADALPRSLEVAADQAATQGTQQVPAEVAVEPPQLPAEADPEKVSDWTERVAQATADSKERALDVATEAASKAKSDSKEPSPDVSSEVAAQAQEDSKEPAPEVATEAAPQGDADSKQPASEVATDVVAQPEADSKEPAPEAAEADKMAEIAKGLSDAAAAISSSHPVAANGLLLASLTVAGKEAAEETRVVSDGAAKTELAEEFQQAPLEASKGAEAEFAVEFQQAPVEVSKEAEAEFAEEFQQAPAEASKEAEVEIVEEFQKAPAEASKEVAAPEFADRGITGAFPVEESKTSVESPSRLAGAEMLPPFVVESWSDAALQKNPVDKGESWTASAEEARPELPHMFWQSALPSSTQSSSIGVSDSQQAEQSTATPAVSAGAPTLPLPPREGLLDKSPGAFSGQSTPSPFRLLPPPPPPTCSVGSNSPLAAQVVKIEELKDQKAQEASGSPANLDAVAAAALTLGHPTKGVALGMEPRVKAYRSRENSENIVAGGDDEETAIVAGAADAEVDDDACELLLGTSDNVDSALPPVRGPRGDGVDSDSEEEQEAHRGPWHKTLPAGATAPEPVDKAAMDPPQAKSWSEVDILVSRRLDKFFSNDYLWQQVVEEIARTKQLQNMEWLQAAPVHTKFKVQVPEPYPGIQYRRSKELSDRYPKYAKHGTTVPGILEDNGEWLKVGENVYLPTKVGAIEILKPLGQVHDNAPAAAPPNATPAPFETTDARFEDFKGAVPTAATSVPDPEEDGCTEAGRVDPRTHTVMRMTALRTPQESLPEPLNTRPLSNLEEASRWLSGVDPNNPFTDTPRGGSSPSESPLRSRLPSDQMAPINPFSDTPPGGSPSVSPLRSRPPASM